MYIIYQSLVELTDKVQALDLKLLTVVASSVFELLLMSFNVF